MLFTRFSVLLRFPYRIYSRANPILSSLLSKYTYIYPNFAHHFHGADLFFLCPHDIDSTTHPIMYNAGQSAQEACISFQDRLFDSTTWRQGELDRHSEDQGLSRSQRNNEQLNGRWNFADVDDGQEPIGVSLRLKEPYSSLHT